MIIKNSFQMRVFNGKGCEHEVLLLLKLFNKYNGMYNILKMVKTLKLVSFDTNEIIKKIYLEFFSKTKILKIIQNKLEILPVLKYILRKYILFLLKNTLDLKDRKMLFWTLSLKQNKNLLNGFEKKNVNMLNSFYKNILLKKHHKFLAKNKYYKSFKTDFNFKKKNNHSIFVIGEVFEYYNGSITPYSKGNYSWFVSTGLKSDVECNDIFLHQELYTIDEDYFPNFYEDKKGKNIIFKIENFQKKVINKIKKNVRHLLYYNSNHFFGLQRFLSQSKTTFNLIQQYRSFKYYLDYSNFDLHFSFLNQKPKIKNLFINMLNNKHINKSVFGLYSQQTKVMFIFFNISKIVLNFYLTLIKTKSKAVSYVSYFLKSLAGFQLISKSFITIFENLFRDYLKKNKTYFFFKLYKRKNKFSKFLQSYFFNISLTKNLINQISKLSFFHFFFDVFIVSMKRNKLTAKLRKENDSLELEEKLMIYRKLDYKPYFFNMYTLYYFYFYFLLDCQLNLMSVLNVEEFKTYSSFRSYEDMIKPFRLLKKKWAYLGYSSIRELHRFFTYFLEIFFINLTNIFYKNFYKKKGLNIQTKFLLSNLFSYLYKLNYKNAQEKGKFFFSNDLMNLIDFFLGNWFYYRQINKFSDQYLDLHYNLSNPSYNLNFSQKENYVYNLNKIRYFGKNISEKLDVYLRANVMAISNRNLGKVNKAKTKLNNLFNLRKFFKKTTQNMRRHRMFSKYYYIKERNNLRLLYGVLKQMNVYRKNRWSRKFHMSNNNLLEVGYNFQLPRKYEKIRKIRKIRFVNRNKKVFRRMTRRIFEKAIKKIYTNSKTKMEDEILTNTFLCIYNNLKKKTPYSKLLFWFNSNVN